MQWNGPITHVPLTVQNVFKMVTSLLLYISIKYPGYTSIRSMFILAELDDMQTFNIVFQQW